MTIELHDVTKKYGSIVALDSVSLTFEVGKIYGVLGANGSGKSTLLKLIAGLAKPDHGEVTVDRSAGKQEDCLCCLLFD